MRLPDRLAAQGQFLFRWRSYVPLILLPAILLALPDAVRVDAGLTEGADTIAFLVCLAVSYCGLIMRGIVAGHVPAGTSGRNTREQRAHELNTTGIYSVVRNPLYVGNFVALLGVVLWVKVWWLVILFVLAYALYIERVVAAEESFLSAKFGPVYQEWADRTPAFLPRLGGWQKAHYPFSWRTVLRREYPGFNAVAIAFLVLDAVKQVAIAGTGWGEWFRTDQAYLWVAGVSMAGYIAVRSLKKHTDALKVTGR